jgi:4'-phosphopantetheinyl transferase
MALITPPMNTPSDAVSLLTFRPAVPLDQQPHRLSSYLMSCPDRTVHVWGFDLDATPNTLAYWHQSLSSEEKQRAERFVERQQGARWVAAQGLKREVLSRYLNRAPHELNFVTRRNGKPVLEGQENEKWHFNLSHSGVRMLLAVSCSGAVGVDIEYQNLARPFLALAQRFFHPLEVASISTMDHEAACRYFYRAWVAKEAVLKAQGFGLAGGLAQCMVPVTAAEQIELPCWTVHWLPILESDGVAALALAPDQQWCWI